MIIESKKMDWSSQFNAKTGSENTAYWPSYRFKVINSTCVKKEDKSLKTLIFKFINIGK